MMTEEMRKKAFGFAFLHATLFIVVSLGIDFMRDLKIDAPIWMYFAGWFVLFLNGFFSERRKAL